MHPLVARFHEEPALFGDKKALIESLLSATALAMASPEFTAVAAGMGGAKADSDFWGEPGSFKSILRPYVIVDGVLQIPVKGVLLNDFPYAYFDYATGYEYIARAFERGMDDDTVRGIALMINSPGGEVAGNFDLVDKMYGYRGTKPVRAFAHEGAYSAAYSIASAADKIVVSRTGGVGSIGVLTSHVSVEKMYEKLGVKVTYIFAGKHKVDGNPFEDLKPEVEARIKSRIDQLYDVFVETVARNRKMDEKAIRDTEAATFTAKEAIENGLADQIGSLEDATNQFALDVLNAQDDGETAMAYSAAEQAIFDKGKEEGRVAGLSEGRATGKAEGADAAKAEGAKAERARISAILDSDEGKKRPTAALATALDSDMSSEQAGKFLAKFPEEKIGEAASTAATNGFDAAMDKAKHPEAGKAAEPAPGDKASGGTGNGGEQLSRAQRALALSGDKKQGKAA